MNNNNSSRSYIDDQGNILTNSFNNNSMSTSSDKFDNGFLDPKKLISLIRRYIWLILVCFLVCAGTSYYLVNYYVLPVFESSGTMLIASNEDSLPGTSSNISGGSGVGKIISNSFGGGYDDPVQGAIYLIESREISKRVAEKLIDIRKSSASNQEFPTLWAEYPTDSSLVSVENASFRIRNGLIVETVAPKTNRLGGGANLIKVSYQSYVPGEAAKIVNLALNEYQEKSLEQKQNTADKALTFLEQKKEEIRTLLNDAEDRLVKYQNTNKLIAIDEQAGNSVNALNNIQSEKQNLRIQLESIDASIDNFERQMEAIKPGMADEYSKAIGPTIANYQKRLAELRTRRFVILSNNPQLKQNPNSEPEVKKLNQQIDELEKEIQSLSKGLVNEDNSYLDVTGTGDGNLAQELANVQKNLIQLRIERNQIESQIRVLDQRIKKTETFLDSYPDKQVTLARLQAEVERHKKLLESFVQQASEVALWQQTQSSNGTIYDDARPIFSPVKPRKILWYGFAAMLGLIIPIGLVLIKDSLNSVINSVDKLKSLPYPVLPVVYDHSLLKRSGWFLNKDNGQKLNNINENVVCYHNADSPLAETYRKIVSQILYSNPDSTPDSILVTSSDKGEGKTTFTGNLATALAEVDKKVLIIDCDFRRPAAHNLFSLNNSLGVNEVIINDGKLSEAIKKTGIQNVDVLTSGAKPPSPAKLLSSSKFKKMLKILKPNYDVILFDTPPQGLVSDVASLLNLTDLVIVAAKFGETKINVLKHTLQELDKNNKSNINLVLTHFKPSKSHDSYETKGLHNHMYQQYYEYEEIQKNK